MSSSRPNACANFFANIKHWRFVALALADHDAALDRPLRSMRGAHRVHRGLIGASCSSPRPIIASDAPMAAAMPHTRAGAGELRLRSITLAMRSVSPRRTAPNVSGRRHSYQMRATRRRRGGSVTASRAFDLTPTARSSGGAGAGLGGQYDRHQPRRLHRKTAFAAKLSIETLASCASLTRKRRQPRPAASRYEQAHVKAPVAPAAPREAAEASGFERGGGPKAETRRGARRRSRRAKSAATEEAVGPSPLRHAPINVSCPTGCARRLATQCVQRAAGTFASG